MQYFTPFHMPRKGKEEDWRMCTAGATQMVKCTPYHLVHLIHLIHPLPLHRRCIWKLRQSTSFTAGNRREPQGTAGNRREPQGTAGNRREPQGTAGNRREPQGTAGNRREPQGTAGVKVVHQRCKEAKRQ